MSSLRVRPRFKEELPISAKEYKFRLSKAIDESVDFTGLVSENYAVIKIPAHERHYWSPQLALTIESSDDNEGVVLGGLYGPKPSVWALFFMCYSALGILSVFVIVIGLSQIILDKPALVLWMLPVLVAVALVLYLVAQAGQKLGAEQMFRIHHFYEDLFKDRISIS